MTIQLAKAKTVRKKRTETELQQKLKKLNPYICRSFISRDLMMYAELFCEDRKDLLIIRFRRLRSPKVPGTEWDGVKIHNNIYYDDKTDKKRLLRLAQVRYRLLAILNAVNAAKDDANIVAQCFTSHIGDGNRLLSALSHKQQQYCSKRLLRCVLNRLQGRRPNRLVPYARNHTGRTLALRRRNAEA